MIIAIDRPPTWKEELRQFLLKTAPGNFFSLPLYTLMLLLGRIDPAIRRPIAITASTGWVLTSTAALSMIVFAPPGATVAHTVWGAIAFGTVAAVLAGTLIYNRVNYGFYL